MKLLKQYKFWISILVGISLFVSTYPFYHDMYIAELFTVLCIFLNAFSAILFSVFLYCKWTKHIESDSRSIFLGFTLMQAVGHAIFAMMNWGSFLFLAISAVILVILAISYFKEKGSESMKKLNVFANVLICVSLGLWAVRALLSYNNYTRHVELFAAEGWLWYTDVLAWGKYIIPVVVILLILKIVIRKKLKD